MRISLFLSNVIANLAGTPAEREALGRFRALVPTRSKPAPTDAKPERILIEVVGDPAYLLKFWYFALAKLRGGALEIDWAIIRIPFRANQPLRRYLSNRFQENSLTDRRWLAKYRLVGGRKALDFPRERPTKADWAAAAGCLERLRTKKELEGLALDGLLVGDLIYDTYLRFRPAATVDLEDPFLLETIATTYPLIRAIRAYFDSRRPTMVVTSYSSYLHHGLLVRLALERGIEVRTLGNYHQLITRPHPGFPFHRRDFHRYREWFDKVPAKDEARAAGRRILEKRLAGQIDQATSYMKTSSFKADDEPGEKLFTSPLPTVLVMGHAFSDSPHIYGDMMFPDFFEWVQHVFEVAKKGGFQLYYKPHPNAGLDDSPVVAKLRADNPHVEFIDQGVSNRRIIAEKIDLVLTVYGTIAHELAYCGMKVVCCGSNPHASYEFCKTVLKTEDLDSILRDPRSLKLPIDKSEIEEFCYVHSYRFIDGKLALFPWNIGFDGLSGALSETGDHLRRIDLVLEDLERVDSL